MGLHSENSAQQKLDLLRERVELEWSESRLTAAEYSLVKLRIDSGNTQREVSAAIERLNSYLEAYFVDVIGRIEELTLLAREPSLPEIVNGKRDRAPSEPTQILPAESSKEFSTVEAVRALVDKLDQQREELSGYLTSDHPSIKMIDEKISLALSHLDQALANSSEQDAGNPLAPDQNPTKLGEPGQLPRLFLDSKTHQRLSLDKILERELEAKATIESLFADYDQATQRHFEATQQEQELLANLWSQRRIETMDIEKDQSNLREPMNPFGTTWTIIAAIAALATGGVASIVSSPDPAVIETISHAQFALPIPLIGAVAASGFAPREKHRARAYLGRWIVRGAEATLIGIAICLVVYLLRTPGAWDLFFNSPAKAYIAVVESMLG